MSKLRKEVAARHRYKERHCGWGYIAYWMILGAISMYTAVKWWEVLGK